MIFEHHKVAFDKSCAFSICLHAAIPRAYSTLVTCISQLAQQTVLAALGSTANRACGFMPGLPAIASQAISAVLSCSTKYGRSSVSGRPALTSLADQMPSQCCPCGPQAAFAQASFLLWSQPAVKATVVQESVPYLQHSSCKSVSTGKVAAVQAEFAQAGISAEATLKVLKQDKPVLNWDIELSMT